MIQINNIYYNDVVNMLIRVNSITYEDDECFMARMECNTERKLLKSRMKDWKEVGCEM